MAEFWQEFGRDIDDTSCEDNKNLHHNVRDYYGFYMKSFAKLDCRVRVEGVDGGGGGVGVGEGKQKKNSELDRLVLLRTMYEPSRVKTIYPLGIQPGLKLFESLDSKVTESSELNTDACLVHSDPYTFHNRELDYITKNAGIPTAREFFDRKDVVDLVKEGEGVKRIIKSDSTRKNKDSIMGLISSSSSSSVSSPPSVSSSISSSKNENKNKNLDLFQSLLLTRLTNTQHLADAFWGPLARRGLDLTHFLRLPRASVAPRAWFWNELQDRFRRREGCHGTTILLFAITFHRFLFRELGFAVLGLWAGTIYMTLGGAESIEGYDYGFIKEDVWSTWSGVAGFLGDICLAELEKLIFVEEDELLNNGINGINGNSGGSGINSGIHLNRLSPSERDRWRKERNELKQELLVNGTRIIPRYCSRFFFDSRLKKLRGPRGIDAYPGPDDDLTNQDENKKSKSRGKGRSGRVGRTPKPEEAEIPRDMRSYHPTLDSFDELALDIDQFRNFTVGHREFSKIHDLLRIGSLDADGSLWKSLREKNGFLDKAAKGTEIHPVGESKITKLFSDVVLGFHKGLVGYEGYKAKKTIEREETGSIQKSDSSSNDASNDFFSSRLLTNRLLRSLPVWQQSDIYLKNTPYLRDSVCEVPILKNACLGFETVFTNELPENTLLPTCAEMRQRAYMRTRRIPTYISKTSDGNKERKPLWTPNQIEPLKSDENVVAVVTNANLPANVGHDMLWYIPLAETIDHLRKNNKKPELQLFWHYHVKKAVRHLFRKTKRLATDKLYATKLSGEVQQEMEAVLLKMEKVGKRVLGVGEYGGRQPGNGRGESGSGGDGEETEYKEVVDDGDRTMVGAKMKAIHRTLKLRSEITERDSEWMRAGEGVSSEAGTTSNKVVTPSKEDIQELRNLSEQLFSGYFLNVTKNEFKQAFYHNDILRKFLDLAETAQHTLHDARGEIRCYKEIVWGRGPLYDPRHRYGLREIKKGEGALATKKHEYLGQNVCVGGNSDRGLGALDSSLKDGGSGREVVSKVVSAPVSMGNPPKCPIEKTYSPSSVIPFARNNADQFVTLYRNYLREREWKLETSRKLVLDDDYLREKVFHNLLLQTDTNDSEDPSASTPSLTSSRYSSPALKKQIEQNLWRSSYKPKLPRQDTRLGQRNHHPEIHGWATRVKPLPKNTIDMYGIFELLQILERDVAFPLPVAAQKPCMKVPVVGVSTEELRERMLRQKELIREAREKARESKMDGQQGQQEHQNSKTESIEENEQETDLGTPPAPRELPGFVPYAEILDDMGEFYHTEEPESGDIFVRLMQSKGRLQYEYIYPLTQHHIINHIPRNRPKALLLNRPVPYPRRIINVGQLFNFLVLRYGQFFEWQLVEGLEQFDSADQMRLFAGAKLIIAGMGTSLHMMAGMRDDNVNEDVNNINENLVSDNNRISVSDQTQLDQQLSSSISSSKLIRPTVIELAPMMLLQTKRDERTGKLVNVKDDMGPYECNENLFEDKYGYVGGQARQLGLRHICFRERCVFDRDTFDKKDADGYSTNPLISQWRQGHIRVANFTKLRAFIDRVVLGEVVRDQFGWEE